MDIHKGDVQIIFSLNQPCYNKSDIDNYLDTLQLTEFNAMLNFPIEDFIVTKHSKPLTKENK